MSSIKINIDGYGITRFSHITDSKIGLEFVVPITCCGEKFSQIKVKSRYKQVENNWLLLPIGIKFIRNMSMSNSIKMKNIKLIYSSREIYIVVNSIEYKISGWLESIDINDRIFLRNCKLHEILSE